jgi:hypothetical protein
MKRFLISTFFLQVIAIMVIFIVGASVGAETGELVLIVCYLIHYVLLADFTHPFF